MSPKQWLEEHKDDYTLNEAGLIDEPGRLEGEPLYTAYYDEMAGISGEDEEFVDVCGTLYSIFFVDADDRAAFELDDDTYAVIYWVCDQGFCNTVQKTKDEYDKWMEEEEAAMEDEGAEVED